MSVVLINKSAFYKIINTLTLYKADLNSEILYETRNALAKQEIEDLLYEVFRLYRRNLRTFNRKYNECQKELNFSEFLDGLETNIQLFEKTELIHFIKFMRSIFYQIEDEKRSLFWEELMPCLMEDFCLSCKEYQESDAWLKG